MLIRKIICIGVLIVGLIAFAESAESKTFLSKIEVTKGICAVNGDIDIAFDIAKNSDFIVLLRMKSKNIEFEEECYEAGILSKKLYITIGDDNIVSAANNYLDFMIVGDSVNIAEKEIERVLQPNGIAFKSNGEQIFKKPLLQNTDNWGHWFHSPTNNTVSKDELLKWPLITQWMDFTFAGAQARIVLYSDGVCYSATGATGGVKFEGSIMYENRYKLTARNGFNGTLLWKKDLVPETTHTASSRFVAYDGKIYYAQENAIKIAVGKTGEELTPINAEEFVKYIAISENKLVSMVGVNDLGTNEVTYSNKKKYPVPPVSRITLKYNWGFGKTIKVFSLDGKLLWKYKANSEIDSRLIAISNGKIFFGQLAEGVAALDLKTGKVLWKADSEIIKKGTTISKKWQKKNNSNSLNKSKPSMLCDKNVIIFRGIGTPTIKYTAQIKMSLF